MRNHDCQGNDMSIHKATEIQQCMGICDNTQDCMGIVFVDAWVGDDNCWLKPTGKCNPVPDNRPIGVHTAIKSIYYQRLPLLFYLDIS